MEPDYRRDRSILTLDAFSDSSWGDERSTRRSTTSGMVFANGCLILSICRAQATIALSSCEAELYAANSTMVECIYLHQLAQFLMGSVLDVRQRLFLDSSSAKFVVQRSGVGKLKHVEIKHMFLQQLLRQGIFTIHKIPTRVNPADLNTKKLSVERRKLLSNLCGLYPICAQSDRDEEVLMTRRIQRNMAHKLVQALQVVSMSLLQGCSHNLSGKELRGEQGLHDGYPGSGPVQALFSTMSSWWSTSWSSTTWWTSSSTRMLVAAMAIGAMVVLATLVGMVPRRGRGAQRGGRRGVPGRGGHREGEGYPDRRGPGEEEQADNRATGSRDVPLVAEEEDRSTRRSRTASRGRGEARTETIAALHRKVALMFATVVEGNYVPRQPVTLDGVKTTLKHLLAASRTLDSGDFETLREAFNCLDGPQEQRAKRLLNDMLYAWERRHGRLELSAAGALCLGATTLWIPGVEVRGDGIRPR